MNTLDTLNRLLDNMVNIQSGRIPLLLISSIGLISGTVLLLKKEWLRFLGLILMISSSFTLLIAVSPAFRNLLF